MDGGYIRLYRKITQCEILRERGRAYSRLEAWIDIILTRAAGVSYGDLGRGEFKASTRFLAKAWNWDRSKVIRFLANLRAGDDPMIRPVNHSANHSANHNTNHFIICKYDFYNGARSSERTTPRTTSRTKVKEGHKESHKEGLKENTSRAAGAAVESLPSVESFQLSERLKLAIAKRDPNAKAAKLPDLTHWARDIDKLLRIDGRRAEDVEAVIVWCQQEGCFWAPNILSGRKLREQFDTLYGQMKRDQGGGNGNSRNDRMEDSRRACAWEPRYEVKKQ